MKKENASIADGQLLEEYFHTYFEALHRYAYTILKDSEEARDVVQSVFIQLWHKRQDQGVRQSIRAYLYSATHNKCLNRLRDNKTRQKHHTMAAARDTGQVETGQDIEAKDLKNEILQVINTLPDKCREIFYKSRFEEKTYAEIARELQVSVKTVETQMTKALRIVRTSIAGKSYWTLLVFLFINEAYKNALVV